MRVRAYPADLSGCGYYRIVEPVAAAQRAGVDASYSYDFPNVLKRRPDGTQKVVGLSEVLDADVVVFHRALDYRIADSIKFLRQAGIGVVVDLDDDYHAVNRDGMFWQLHHPDRNPRENFAHLQRACKAADVVTCSVPLIARRWGMGHGVVVRNGIPPHVLDMEHVGGGGIGWSGETSSHVGDLAVCGDGVQRALEATGLPFTLIGHDEQTREVADQLGLHEIPKATGWTEPGKHFENIAKLDIGIAPLANTPMAQARSGVKVLEYAALGIPAVASMQSEYVTLALHGIGHIADSPGEWETLLVEAAQEGSGTGLRDLVSTTDQTVTAAIDAWELAQKKAQRRLAKPNSAR